MINIFNGQKEIEITEGSTFDLPGIWQWRKFDEIVFHLKEGYSVTAQVINVTGSGTELKVLKIKSNDSLNQTKADAVDVEDVEVDSVDETKVIEISKKTTKKDLIELITNLGLDVNTKTTKKEILASLEEIENVKLV